MITTKVVIVRIFLPCMALLGGCGGDSGGSTTSTTPAAQNLNSAPGDAAVGAYYQQANQTTLSARDSAGNSYTLQLGQTPNTGTTTFEGRVSVHSFVRTTTLSKNGAVASTGFSNQYFLLSPFMPLGDVNSTGVPYGVFTLANAFPTTISVGTSGPIGTETYYHNSAKSIQDAVEVVTYRVAANNATTLLFCLDAIKTLSSGQGSLDGLSAGTESDCYTDDASGSVRLASITISVSGTTLIFQ